MRTVFTTYALAIPLLALAACTDAPPPSAYQTYSPEKLLVSTSDVVTIDLAAGDYAQQLGEALAHNPPSRAILNCAPGETYCKNAGRMLIQHKIAMESTGAGSDVTLIYEHIAARDCDQRYVDNSQNERNLNYEALGCSNAANMAQMVTDKRQFTNPGLLDYRDGEKTESGYDGYLVPSAASSGSPTGGSGSESGSSLIPSSGGQ